MCSQIIKEHKKVNLNPQAHEPPPVSNAPPGGRRLATIENAAKYFSDAGETPSAIRAKIFKAEDRYNSRGEKIKGNGLAETGAIIRCGRKILLDIDLYAAHLAGQGKKTD